MFHYNDIVTPKEGFRGHGYYFSIIEIKMEADNESLYKLERIEQKVDPLKGSFMEHQYKLAYVENRWWKESNLILTTPVETTIELKANENLTNLTINTDGITLTKGENKMNILEIYKERKIKTLEKEFSEAKKVAIEEDEIQKIIIEMTNQVNTILENEDSDTRYESHPNLYTSKTEAKLNKLNDKYHEQIEELRSTLDEIRALFELTDDYNERIKILKNYDILDKRGKLNV